jgi:hypothetical protein
MLQKVKRIIFLDAKLLAFYYQNVSGGVIIYVTPYKTVRVYSLVSTMNISLWVWCVETP